jgi:hypothetical protein
MPLLRSDFERDLDSLIADLEAEESAQKKPESWALPEPENQPEEPEQPGYGEVFIKSLARGVEGLAQGVGSLTRWAGEATGVEPVAEAGKEASDYWEEAQTKGWAKRDPNLHRGTFMENPSVKRAFSIATEAAPSMAFGMGAGGMAMKGLQLSQKAAGWIAGTALGALEGSGDYEGARDAGKSIGEASISGLASTAGTAILESLAIGKLLGIGKAGKALSKVPGAGRVGKIAGKTPKTIKDLGTGIVTEGSQEVSQTVWQNLVAKVGYEPTRDLAEGIVESFIGGAGVGGVTGATMGKINRALEKARAAGVPEEDLEKAHEELVNEIEGAAETAMPEEPGRDYGPPPEDYDIPPETPDEEPPPPDIPPTEPPQGPPPPPPQQAVERAVQAGGMDRQANDDVVNSLAREFDMSQYGLIESENPTQPQLGWDRGSIIEQAPEERMRVQMAGRTGSMGTVEDLQGAQAPTPQWQESNIVDEMPVPERPTALDRLRGNLYNKEGRFVEGETEIEDVEGAGEKPTAEQAFWGLRNIAQDVYSETERRWINSDRDEVLTAIEAAKDAGVDVEYIKPTSRTASEVWMLRFDDRVFQLSRDPQTGRTVWHDHTRFDETEGSGEKEAPEPSAFQIGDQVIPTSTSGLNPEKNSGAITNIQTDPETGEQLISVNGGAHFKASDFMKEGQEDDTQEVGEITEKTAEEEPPQVIGTAWVKNKWKPIVDAREIRRGKRKGKFIVTFGNGKSRMVETVRLSETEKPETTEIEEAAGAGEKEAKPKAVADMTPEELTAEAKVLGLGGAKRIADPNYKHADVDIERLKGQIEEAEAGLQEYLERLPNDPNIKIIAHKQEVRKAALALVEGEQAPLFETQHAGSYVGSVEQNRVTGEMDKYLTSNIDTDTLKAITGEEEMDSGAGIGASDGQAVYPIGGKLYIVENDYTKDNYIQQQRLKEVAIEDVEPQHVKYMTGTKQVKNSHAVGPWGASTTIAAATEEDMARFHDDLRKALGAQKQTPEIEDVEGAGEKEIETEAPEKSTDPRTRYGERYLEEPRYVPGKKLINMAKDAPYGQLIHSDGSITNGSWLFLPGEAPKDVQKWIEKAPGTRREDIDYKSVLDPIKDGEGFSKARFLFAIKNKEAAEIARYGHAIFENEEGKRAAFSEGAFAHFNKQIKDFSMEFKDEDKPALLKSGDRVVGLLMPYRFNKDKLESLEIAAPETAPQSLEGASVADIMDVFDQETGAKGKPKSTGGGRTSGPRTGPAREKLKEAGGHLKSAAGAVAEINRILGEGGAVGKGARVDETKWQRIKPLLQTVWDEALATGKSVKEFVHELMAAGLNRNARPYVERFVNETINGETTTETETETEIEDVEGAGSAEEGETEKPKKKKKKDKKPKKKRKKKLADVGEVLPGKRSSQDNRERTDAIKIELDEVLPEDVSAEKIVNALIRITNRAKAFKIDPPDGCTFGVKPYLEYFRKQIKPFAELAGSRLGGSKRRWRPSFKEAMIDSIRHERGDDNTVQEDLRKMASQYLATLEQLSEAARGATTVAQARDGIISVILADKTKIGIEGFEEVYNIEPGQDGALFGNEANGASEVGENLYRFMNGSWYQIHGLLSDTADKFIETENEPPKDLPIDRKKRRLVDIETDGKHRDGDMSAEALLEHFSLRGVDFGDWTDAEHRQISVNLTFDSLYDLADIIGAPPTAMGLPANPDPLGIGFGSRGRGKMATWFTHPDNIINLAKTTGDGAVAHEWSHAFDFMTNLTLENNNEEQYQSYNAIDDLKHALRHEYRMENLDAVVHDLLKGLHGRNRRGGNRLEEAKQYLKNQWENEFVVKTRFFMNAKGLDEGGRKPYWAKKEEMFARAFEAYVADKMQGENVYLVDTNFVAPGGVESMFNRRHGAYPTDEERTRFNEIFDHFFEGIEWAEDGKPSMKADYVPVTIAEHLKAEETVAKLLDKLEDIYNSLYQGESSKDGLWWYAYKETSRGPMMQPNGAMAFDDDFTQEVAEGEEAPAGQGAVGYPEALLADDVIGFGLTPIAHEQNDTTIYQEVEDGGSVIEDWVAGQGALGEASTKDGGASQGDGGLQTGPSGSTTEGGGPGGGTGLEEGGSIRDGVGSDNQEVDIPPVGDGSADTAPDQMPYSQPDV